MNDMESMMELKELIFDLAERSYVRVLMRWGAITAQASMDETMQAAEEIEATNLVAGLRDLVGHHAEGGTLAGVQEELDGLANAWAPIDDQDEKIKAVLMTSLSEERREMTCAPLYSPRGLKAVGLSDEDQRRAIGWPRE